MKGRKNKAVYFVGECILIFVFGFWYHMTSGTNPSSLSRAMRALEGSIMRGAIDIKLLRSWEQARGIKVPPNQRDFPFLLWTHPDSVGSLNALRAVAQSALTYDFTVVATAAIRKADPYKDSEMRALEAHLELLLAREAMSSSTKMLHTENALRMVQEAFEKAPDNIEIRKERLIIHTHLPSFFSDRSLIDRDRKFLKEKGIN